MIKCIRTSRLPIKNPLSDMVASASRIAHRILSSKYGTYKTSKARFWPWKGCGRSTKTISTIKWIRTSRLSIKNSLPGETKKTKTELDRCLYLFGPAEPSTLNYLCLSPFIPSSLSLVRSLSLSLNHRSLSGEHGGPLSSQVRTHKAYPHNLLNLHPASYKSAVEPSRHTQDSHGQILALAFRHKALKPFRVSSFRSGVGSRV